MFTDKVSTSMEEHPSRIESHLLKIVYEFLEIKKHLNLSSSQVYLLKHLVERRQTALNLAARRQAVTPSFLQ